MNPCLTQICQEFEVLKGFLKHKTQEQETLVNKLFLEFIECFNSLKEEKLDYP
ncbi:hypothetical protein KKC13_12330 [bacterium]|nr:hypothetical protein [bacterium]MBU1958746.1 hypothetical protein [bacterium]